MLLTIELDANRLDLLWPGTGSKLLTHYSLCVSLSLTRPQTHTTNAIWIRSCRMNLTSRTVPLRMVMILSGRLWTNPMMTPVKLGVVPFIFTILPSLQPRRMENSRFKPYRIEPSGIATIMSRKCGNTKKHFSNRAWYRVGRNSVSREVLWKLTLSSPVTPSLAECGPRYGCWVI